MNACIAALPCRLSRLTIVLILGVWLSAAAFSAGKIVELNFVKMDVVMALRAVADITRTNIVISPDVTGLVTLKLHNSTAEEAIKAVVEMLPDCTYTITDNNIYVVSKKGTDGAKMEAMFLSLTAVYRRGDFAPR